MRSGPLAELVILPKESDDEAVLGKLNLLCLNVLKDSQGDRGP